MAKTIDFSISSIELLSIISTILFPVILIIITKIKLLKNKNALQFFFSSLISIVLWISILPFIIHNNLITSDFISSIMILFTAILVYLEVWALLSRGYTIAILLTINKAPSPLNDKELANAYRGGIGLKWLLNHRLSGLFAAKLITKKENFILLTNFPGKIVINIYKILIYLFCLKKTG